MLWLEGLRDDGVQMFALSWLCHGRRDNRHAPSASYCQDEKLYKFVIHGRAVFAGGTARWRPYCRGWSWSWSCVTSPKQSSTSMSVTRYNICTIHIDQIIPDASCLLYFHCYFLQSQLDRFSCPSAPPVLSSVCSSVCRSFTTFTTTKGNLFPLFMTS